MYDLLELLFTFFELSWVFEALCDGVTVSEETPAGFLAAWKKGRRESDEYAAFVKDYERKHPESPTLRLR